MLKGLLSCFDKIQKVHKIQKFFMIYKSYNESNFKRKIKLQKNEVLKIIKLAYVIFSPLSGGNKKQKIAII